MDRVRMSVRAENRIIFLAAVTQRCIFGAGCNTGWVRLVQKRYIGMEPSCP
jgi:hypothetical protein